MIYSYNKSQQDAPFLNFILVKNSTCFGNTYCSSSAFLILYSKQLVFVILVMLTVCYRGRDGTHPDLASRPFAVNTVLRLLMMNGESVRKM